MKLYVAAAMILATAACGRSEQQAEAERAAANVEQGAAAVQQAAEGLGRNGQASAEQMTQGLQQMAQGFQQMAQGAAKPVDFESLVALLPSLDGWTRTDPYGEQVSMGVAMSRAEVIFRKDDSRIEIEITDSALNQMILAPLSMFTAMGYSERSSEGFKRGATIKGHPGFEEWNSQSKHGEVTAIVANRFIVSAKGDDIAALDPVRNAIEAVDLSKLAALK